MNKLTFDQNLKLEMRDTISQKISDFKKFCLENRVRSTNLSIKLSAIVLLICLTSMVNTGFSQEERGDMKELKENYTFFSKRIVLSSLAGD